MVTGCDDSEPEKNTLAILKMTAFGSHESHLIGGIGHHRRDVADLAEIHIGNIRYCGPRRSLH
jgi:hypothetical protein